MACGTPVLTSRRVGAAELMGPSGRELLMESPGPEALARGLERMLKNASLRRRLGEEGVAACRGNTWEENFKKTLACYQRLLKSR